VGGLLAGSFYPLVDNQPGRDAGLGPYAIAFMFAAGIFFSTFIYNLFFMNLAVQGRPVEMLEYCEGTLKQTRWGSREACCGRWSDLRVSWLASAPEAHLSRLTYGLGQGAAVVGALWGLLAWKEFATATRRRKS